MKTSLSRTVNNNGTIINADASADYKYSIAFQDSLFQSDNSFLLDAIKDKKHVVFYDEHYNSLMGNKLHSDIMNTFKTNCLGVYPVMTNVNGAEKKDIETLFKILDDLLLTELDRRGIVIAIGGGALLDVVGLAAQLYRRSVSWIRIPTTLIGQVDAGIGIKVGINYKNKKNILGAFYPPIHVVNCLDFISDLDETQIEGGFAEIIKIAFSCSGSLVDTLLEYKSKGELRTNMSGREIFAINSGKEISNLIYTSCSAMIEQLNKDFYERSSLRRLVDFGHTFSSFIEEKSDFEIRHGYAVAIDMMISIYISKNIGFINTEIFDIYQHILCKLVSFKRSHLSFVEDNAERMFDESIPRIIQHRGGDLNYVIPCGYGNAGFINLDTCSDKTDNYIKIMSFNELRDVYLLSFKEMISDIKGVS